MIGQGSPNGAFRQIARRPLAGVWRWLFVAAALAGLPPCEGQADDVHLVHLRLRLEWGGALSPLAGMIRVNTGTLESPRALGVDADEPGSIWAESGQVFIRSPSRRSYDGMDVTVTRRLPRNYRAIDQCRSSADTSLTIPLADVLDEYRSYALDNQGSRLLAVQPPATSWSCVARNHLVCAWRRARSRGLAQTAGLALGTRLVQARLLGPHGRGPTGPASKTLSCCQKKSVRRRVRASPCRCPSRRASTTWC